MNKKLHGFTLLEAIVALVLMATTGVTVLSWINTNLLTLQRLQQIQQRHEAIRNALTFIDTRNPLEQPQGEETVGIYKFSWNATVVEPPKSGADASGAKTTFEVGLYDTRIKVSSQEILLAELTVRQVGYRQLYKDFSDDF